MENGNVCRHLDQDDYTTVSVLYLRHSSERVFMAQVQLVPGICKDASRLYGEAKSIIPLRKEIHFFTSNRFTKHNVLNATSKK